MDTPFIHSISEADERELPYASLTEIHGIQPKTVSKADEIRKRSASLNRVGKLGWFTGLTGRTVLPIPRQSDYR